MASPDAVLIGDTVVLDVEAKDPEGRVLLEPPLEWEYAHPDGWNPMELVDTAYGRAWAAGLYPRTATFQVRVPGDDPWFTGEPLSVEIPVQFEPMTVQFLNVGRDTVLTERGPFTLYVSAVDQKGRPPRAPATGWIYGDFSVTIRQGRVSKRESIQAQAGKLNFSADSIGPDTIIVTHTACPNPCGDTLAVWVGPTAASLDLSTGPHRSIALGDTVRLDAVVRDPAGYELPGLPVTWRLSNPADSGILKFIDPSAGIIVTRGNGTAQVAATSGDLAQSASFYVYQEVAQFEVKVPAHVVGVGTNLVAGFAAWDLRGTPIDSSITIPQTWSTDDPSTLGLRDVHYREAVYETLRYASTNADLQLHVCRAVGECWWQVKGAPVRIIPEPDSVRAYPESGSTTLDGLGATATLLGNIYLAGETIGAVPLFWNSLNPAVATIDENGLMTAVASGSARIVGTMGTAADTVTMTVVG